MLKLGSDLPVKRGRGLCRNLTRNLTSLWTFLKIPGVEPTNNTSERAIRRAVIWRKKCQGTRSDGGSEFVSRILTVAATCRQHHGNVLDYLTQACEAALRGLPPPSLIPADLQSCNRVQLIPVSASGAHRGS